MEGYNLQGCNIWTGIDCSTGKLAACKWSDGSALNYTYWDPNQAKTGAYQHGYVSRQNQGYDMAVTGKPKKQ